MSLLQKNLFSLQLYPWDLFVIETTDGLGFHGTIFCGWKKLKVTNGHKEVIFCPFHGVLFDNILSNLSLPTKFFRYLNILH